ncbi:MAG TPA: DevR family CRISPR-associated autoregulator [Firmicutes bacterium]|nr:DevR family CRISPR-associated autoregulator [Candidatus Fermentithermobacillaceae bacterium]
MATSVYSLSISGRVILDMHSLNNEGGEGNQITTRMVNIVYNDPDTGEPRLASVNAISGDMFKHIQAEHLYLKAKTDGLPLCAGCQVFSASRVLNDEEFMGNLPQRDAEVIDALLRRCVIDDLAGNLIAKEPRSIPRKSVAEFAWVVGIPEVTRTESYFHVRYAAERGERVEGEERVTQPIFHRPASSGVYATIATFEIARIGFNDISQTYAIDQGERERRYKALLESVLYTFLEPNGAMRGTQNPHILGFEGAVTISTQVVPAPALSPLDDGYIDELKRIADAMNGVRSGAVLVREFDSMGRFAEIMRELIAETKPYSLFGDRG